jgi:hypothetical protein
VTTIEIFSSRPWLSPRASGYPFDPPPRFLIGNTPLDGSWSRDEPATIEVPPGLLHVEARAERSHPIAALISKRIPLRSAQLDFDVPADSERVVLEFRASRLRYQPGTIEVRHVVLRPGA